MQGQAQTVRYLLDKGACVNAKTEDGETPLHLAVKGNFLSICIMLLECGAEVDAMRGDGSTVLHLCAISGNIEMTRHLIASGANANVANNGGVSAADLARQYAHGDVAAAMSGANSANGITIEE